MRLPRIYTAQLLETGIVIELEHQPMHHLRVLRLEIGSPLYVFNGQGGQFHAQVKQISKKHIAIEIGTFQEKNVESPLKIHLAQAISRSEHMDYAIQKAVELGVASIVPVITERCNVKLDDIRFEKRLHRWKAIAIGACEQSGRCRIPDIYPASTLHHWQPPESDLYLICHPARSNIFQPQLSISQVSLIIGPEGGFTSQEIELMEQRKFKHFYMGPRVLRTETATVAALVMLQSCWGDMNPDPTILHCIAE